MKKVTETLHEVISKTCFFMQGQLDEVYMRCWAKELGLQARLEEVLAADNKEYGT